MAKAQKKKKPAGGTLHTESSLRAVSMKTETNPEAIAARAYELFGARGCADGHALDDWIEAERQLEAAAQHPSTDLQLPH